MSDLSPEAQALVTRARDGDAPSLEDRRRIREALGVSLAAGTALAATTRVATAAAKGAVPAAAGVVTASKIAAWVSVGALAGIGAMSTALWVSDTSRGVHASVPASKAEVLPDTPLQATSPAARTPTAAAAEQVEAAPPAAKGAASPARSAKVGSAPSSRSSTADAPSSLAAETSLLAEARAALGRGDATTALALLSEHERTFPTGTLVEERLASQVFALCDLGRRADAARVAALLLRDAPDSPHRARVLDSCAYRP